MFQTDTLLQVDPWLIVIGIIFLVIFIVITVIWGIKAHRRQASTGREELIGQVAEVETALDPRGIIFLHGERWTALSEEGRVEPGEEVVITRIDGLRLYVTTVKNRNSIWPAGSTPELHR